MIVAITGRSGSGKSYVAAYYLSLGFTVIDADIVAREVLSSNKALVQELVSAFGNDIIDANGALLRKELANKAFATENEAALLTKITHPRIVEEILQQANASKCSPVFVDGAVIVGELFEQYCDKLIVITAPHSQAIGRIVERDKISRTAAENRLAAQTPEEILRERADYIIHNNGGKEALLAAAERVVQELKAMS